MRTRSPRLGPLDSIRLACGYTNLRIRPHTLTPSFFLCLLSVETMRLLPRCALISAPLPSCSTIDHRRTPSRSLTVSFGRSFFIAVLSQSTCTGRAQAPTRRHPWPFRSAGCRYAYRIPCPVPRSYQAPACAFALTRYVDPRGRFSRSLVMPETHAQVALERRSVPFLRV